jgi:hypothetical protein
MSTPENWARQYWEKYEEAPVERPEPTFRVDVDMSDPRIMEARRKLLGMSVPDSIGAQRQEGETRAATKARLYGERFQRGE